MVQPRRTGTSMRSPCRVSVSATPAAAATAMPSSRSLSLRSVPAPGPLLLSPAAAETGLRCLPGRSAGAPTRAREPAVLPTLLKPAPNVCMHGG